MRICKSSFRYINTPLQRCYSMTPSDYTVLISKAEVQDFCERCMKKVGTKPSHAQSLAKVLVEGDFRGHYSHGFNRLEMYVKDVEKKVCEINQEPKLVKETESTAYVDGMNVLGPVVGNFSMDIAIAKAKKTGIALGISFTNTSPLVYANRSKKASIGTNPIAFAAPTKDPKNEFVLDMATSAVAVGKIEMCKRKGHSLPAGWGADKEGKLTTKPSEAIEGGLLPLGGAELTSGYKGTGLGMMVEMFCGILSGATYGINVRKWMNTTRPADLGQAFMAINPHMFADGFSARADDYVNMIRNLPRADEAQPVLVAGDPEREHIKEVARDGGIFYPPVLIDSLDQLADRLQVPRLKCLKRN
ncbi:hypothetical protein Ciccas_008744 [Cichlidogyrus casuarinus]|uniref:Malate dehydrogenase n=1 Tax=Cichlidogyrus casuarinus TaxID=1844966 RepID=A0ABD2PZ13_9PLAT